MTSKITINLDEFRPDESSPERTLFLCVILQALLDASKRAYNGTTAEDFEEVCTNAGVDPDYMRDFAVKVLKTGEIEYVRRRINAILGH